MNDDYDPPDELSPEELAAFRPLALHAFRMRHLRYRMELGITFHSKGSSCWRLRLALILFDVRLTFMTFEAYRRDLLALGPYRNA